MWMLAIIGLIGMLFVWTLSRVKIRFHIVEESQSNFTPDPWLYILAPSSEFARDFVGAPADWPVEYDRSTARGTVWRVKAEGLTVK